MISGIVSYARTSPLGPLSLEERGSIDEDYG